MKAFNLNFKIVGAAHEGVGFAGKGGIVREGITKLGRNGGGSSCIESLGIGGSSSD